MVAWYSFEYCDDFLEAKFLSIPYNVHVYGGVVLIPDESVRVRTFNIIRHRFR